ncbi:V-type ATPase subunit [Patescibacteria group bacterium]|nr:V-type ATPase subunit [Patescibacteria group bacterium]
MPRVDTPYIIAVIRNQERDLLQKDEYTRLLGASTGKEALRVLVATAYGKWLTGEVGSQEVFEALEERLLEVQRWLIDTVDSETVVQFLTARYDALNVATALSDYLTGVTEPGALSRLGSINPRVLTSVIWNQSDWDLLPEFWERVIQDILPETNGTKEPVSVPQILKHVQEAALSWKKLVAVTTLSKRLVSIEQDHLHIDSVLREQGGLLVAASEGITLAGLTNESSPSAIAAAISAAGYTGFTVDLLQAVRKRESATAYERAWDEVALTAAREYRAAPIGFDPIIAFWITLELEVKTIRLIISGKLQGLTSEQLSPLVRSQFLSVTA